MKGDNVKNRNIEVESEIATVQRIVKDMFEAQSDKNRQILRIALMGEKNFDEIGQEFGVSKQWANILYNNFLNGILDVCEGKCLDSGLMYMNRLEPMVANILKKAAWRKLKKNYDSRILNTIKSEISRIVRILSVNHPDGKVPVEEILSEFDGIGRDEMLPFLANMYLIEDGKVVSAEVPSIKEAVIGLLKNAPDGMSVDDIKKRLLEIYGEKENLDEKHILSILTASNLRHMVCNVDKSTYALCDFLKKKYPNIDELAEFVERYALENGRCVLDTKFLVENVPEIREKFHVRNPYVLKSLLRMSDKFKSGKKLSIKLDSPKCEESGREYISDLIVDILRKHMEPLSVIDISKEIKSEYGRNVYIGTISPIVKKLLGEGKILKVSGGYMALDGLRQLLKDVDESKIVELTEKFFEKYPDGFFLELLVPYVIKEKWAKRIDPKEIPFIIRHVLEKHGYPVSGRSKILIVRPKGSTGSVFSKTVSKIKEIGEPVDVVEEAGKFMIEHGLGPDHEEYRKKLEEVKVALYGRVSSEGIPIKKRARGRKPVAVENGG